MRLQRVGHDWATNPFTFTFILGTEHSASNLKAAWAAVCRWATSYSSLHHSSSIHFLELFWRVHELTFSKWPQLRVLLSKYYVSIWASLVVQRVKHLPVVQETEVRSLGQEDPLEKEMATHSSILAWRIPWTEEPGGLQSTWLQRVRHDWVTTHTHKYLSNKNPFNNFLKQWSLHGHALHFWYPSCITSLYVMLSSVLYD